MTDLHPWQVSTSTLTGKLQQPLDSNIVLRIPGAGEEVIRLNKDGFHYRGQLIEDAGEAHRLMVGFLRQGTAPALAEQPVVPTPIPVAERPPKPGELCWWLEPDEDDGYGAQWSLFRLYGITDPYTHWLPANAIPVPTND
jgi:hypothetical protein